jgi:hypothetical protein
VRLAFANAFHFRRVQAVELVLVLPLLGQQPLSKASSGRNTGRSAC